jgi:hypothetical protein
MQHEARIVAHEKDEAVGRAGAGGSWSVADFTSNCGDRRWET